MTTMTSLLVFASILAVAVAQTCTCREHDTTQDCSTVTIQGSACVSQVKKCQGCVCDESGSKTCTLQDAAGFKFATDGSCEATVITHVACPSEDPSAPTATPTPTPSPEVVYRQEIATQCTVTGVVADPLECIFDCFIDSLGDLVNVTIDYTASFKGSFNATNTSPTETANDITLSQGLTTNIFQPLTPGSSSIVFILDSNQFTTSPGLDNRDIAPLETVSLTNITGGVSETDKPVTNPIDFYKCSSDNSGAADEAVALVAPASLATIVGTIDSTFEGDFTWEMNVQYTFDSSTITGTILSTV